MNFSWKNFAILLACTALVGVGEHAVAWQFNDGKMTQKVLGAVFLGMALPSLLMGGVLRIFKPSLQRYFAITAAICGGIGATLILW